MPSLSSQRGNEDVLAASDHEPRPIKRRKIESAATSPSPAIPAPILPEDTRLDASKYVRASWDTFGAEDSSRSTCRAPVLDDPTLLPKLPLAASHIPDPSSSRTRSSCRYRAIIRVPNKPDALHCPGDAPLLELDKPADYYPWKGHHPEDVINETNVKSGYWDRAPQPADRESNTAKTPLYTAFKHKNGLDSLSTLFSLVLEQKTRQGALPSTSTFRPPPRVTLTEAKRRTWIADLADGSVPLRKLSRTIPQGIRGAQLLELCSSNNIPVNRALWFVKCVGANEVRTLKRKGAAANAAAGAETIWLKDWTGSIESFLGTSIEQTTTEQWSTSWRYALQLTLRLYHEILLDQDHFLDWIVSGLSSCKLQLLPVWTGLAESFQHDLLRFRKKARQMAAALLSRLQEMQTLSLVKNSLCQKLRSLVRGIAYVRPTCFLMPDQWKKSSVTFGGCLRPDNQEDQRIHDHIRARNERMLALAVPSRKAIDVDRIVYEYLDSTGPSYDIGSIANHLESIPSNRPELIKYCLLWATSRYRAGQARVYLIVRLVRKWIRANADNASTVLSFFASDQDFCQFDLDNYRHVFAELSRTNMISKSRFLQEVSVKGLTASSPLLRDLWLAGEPAHLSHLRNSLLKKSGGSCLEDSRTIIDRVLKSLREIGCSIKTDTSNLRFQTMMQMSWSARFELSKALRKEVVSISQSANLGPRESPSLADDAHRLLCQFALVRNVLEVIGDVAVLADVLHLLSGSKQEALLIAMVDTLHSNGACLSALGAFQPLQEAFAQSYISLRTTGPSLPHFTAALLDLSQSFACSMLPTKALQQDFVRGDRGRMLTACSPFSDGVAESLQQAGATFIDDFEAILQGEPNMNEQTMALLFNVLTSRIEKHDRNEEEELATLCQLLARLRLFRIAQADELLQNWLQRLFSGPWSDTFVDIMVELIYNRCVSVDSFLTITASASAIRDLVRDITAGQTPNSMLSIDSQKDYVVRIAVRKFISTYPECALKLITEKGCTLSTPTSAKVAFAALTQLVIERSFVEQDQPLPVHVDDLLGQFLVFEEHCPDALDELLLRISHLSLPFYRANTARSAQTSKQWPDEAGVEAESELVFRGLRLSLEEHEDHHLASQIIGTFRRPIQARVRVMATRQFFNVLPKMFQGKGVVSSLPTNSQDRQRSQHALRKLASLGPACIPDPLSECNGALIEKLTMVAKLLGPATEAAPPHHGMLVNITSPRSPSYQALQHALPAPRWDSRYRETILWILEYLNMFLVVVSMNANCFTRQEGFALSKPQQNEQIKLVAILASIATQPVLTQLLGSGLEDFSKTRIKASIRFTLDVAARFVDDLHEEGRMICTRIMKDRLGDERIMWLFGNMALWNSFSNPSGKGLTLFHETKGFASEFRPRQFELVENGGTGNKDSDSCLALGLFCAKRI